jgi:hypothetical protein
MTDSSRRRRLGFWLALAAGVFLLLGGSYWLVRYWRDRANKAPATPGEDPRLAYDGPFQNVRPDVAYVGSATCAGCHEREAGSYEQHPMGRSLLPIAQIAGSQRYAAATNNPFDALGTQFLVARRGDGLVHCQIGRDGEGKPVYESDTRIDYVLGSGLHGYSYLTDREGYLFESPISWYSQKQIWDKSPGFGTGWRSGRPVPATCLYCHSNRARAVDGAVNRYERPIFDGYAIGCERCHGPGKLHAEAAHHPPAPDIDPTIVNPGHLGAELRAAVCEQCHLAGEARVVRHGRDTYDYRPGLPLDAFWSIYVRAADPDEPRKAVNHVEQMAVSACFAKSADDPATGARKLGCVSCHDPHRHETATERVSHYRARCLNCHETHVPCSESEPARRQKGDSCIDCHMPRYASVDIAHTASTDHRIVRRPDLAAIGPSGRPTREPVYVSFYSSDRRAAAASEDERDLGVALAQILVPLASAKQAPPDRLGRRAVRLLDQAIQNDPQDVKALEARAELLAVVGRPEDAFEEFEAILARYPNREKPLRGAAILAERKQEFDKAASYWGRLVEENPWQADHRSSLGQLLARRGNWDEALAQARAWVRLDPASIEARIFLVRCLFGRGDKADARAEFAKIERLRPSNLTELQKLFAGRLRDK